MSNLRETAQQALEAIDYLDSHPEGGIDEAETAIEALRAALAQPEPAARIKTWNQRCEEYPGYQMGMVSYGMIQARMQEEIDELRSALAQPEPAVQPTAEDIAQDWDLLKETQAALRDAWAILNKLKAVQDAARHLVESDPDSAADTEGEAFTAWCALVAAIDDADTLLCEFGESHE